MDDTTPINADAGNRTASAAASDPNSPSDPSGRSLAQPPIPSKEFQEQAFKYVSGWCKASRDFVKRKVERWKLLEDLYHNRRELNSWSTRSDLIGSESLSGLKKQSGSGKECWQADIILAPSYIVDTWADKAYQSVFDGPEWLTVIPENPQGPSTEDLQFPTSYKLQELLLVRLAEGQIHVRLYEILQHLVLYGSVYAKIFWYSKGVTRHRWDFETLDVVEDEETVYDCPIVQVIPLDRVLLDWTATHSDVQRHSGVGHRVDKTYDHVLEQFERGVYNLNRKEFLSRWENAPSAVTTEDALLHDPDSDDLDTDELGKVTVWEWHGRVPTDKGHKECLCTIITDKGADSPEDGLLVRLTDTPVLWSGLRPFLSAHYTPLPGPLGMGAVESNLDLIHSISQFISQSQDNARLTANAQLIVRRGSSAARQISTDSDVVYPGKIWTVDEPGDIQPFPSLNFPQQEVNSLINYLNGLLERRTTVSDISMGVGGGGKTATEAHILQESALSPFSTRTDLFARSFLEPLGRLALSMLQQFLLEDQTITVRDFSGVDTPVTVTTEEIQTGRYRVVATLTRQDSTRLAKAQSIERVLPTLARFQPILAGEGVQISFSEIIKRYLDLLGVDGVERVLSRIHPSQADLSQGVINQGPDENGISPGGATPFGGNDGARPTPAAPLVEQGGPMGPEPTDANALAQFLQIQANQQSPRRS
jgi:hypothetical protein